MTPLPLQKAANWKQRLSIVYAIVAWNAFGVVCYMAYTGRRDWADFYGYKTEEEKAISPGNFLFLFIFHTYHDVQHVHHNT
jgi:hypothetical protein